MRRGWRWNQMNRGDLEGLPPRIAHLQQFLCTAIPERCPKCQGAGIHVDGRRVACALCGWDGYLYDARKPPEEPERVARKTPARSLIDIGEPNGAD